MPVPELHELLQVQGVRRDVRSDVQQICQLLNEYLEGFAFLKELIQNADDAEATEVLVAWHPGFGANAPHALLQGPGLLVANNGSFKEEHKQGIRNLGLGTSAADAEKIGRFGLGIKSVFHVCEAFFFFESNADPILRSLFSPWFDEFHSEWRNGVDGWAPVWKCLQEECERQTCKFKWQKWFALWIPLRQKEHCGAPGAIRQDADAFPGEHETCPESLIAAFKQVTPRIEETLLLLKKLQRIHFNTGSREEVYKRPDKNSGGHIRQASKVVCGAVDITSWQSLPKWPKVFSGRDDNVTGMVPDKARWDAAVAITVSRDALATGRLRVFWSVYLPVGNAPALDVPIPGLHADIHLFLHGFFFLNRSRTEILGVHDGFDGANENDERGIRLAWNRALATETSGLLPLLISALDECFNNEDLPERQIRYIIAALQSSSLFQNPVTREPICRSVRFGRYLVEGRWNWKAIESGRGVLVLPGNGVDPEKAEPLLAGLLSKESTIAHVIEGSAELSDSQSNVDWTAQALKRLAARIINRPFEQAEREYLRSVLLDKRFPEDALEAWSDFEVFEIRSVCSGAKRPASFREIQALWAEHRIFSPANPELERELAQACPGVVAWVLETAGPPNVSSLPLDFERVASLVLRHEKLGIASQRKELLSILAGNIASEEIRRAARYLLHGNADQRSDTTTRLLFNGNQWEEPTRVLLSCLNQEWACVDGLFSSELSEREKALLSSMNCGADAFRKLSRAVDPSAIPAALTIGHHAEFLIGNLHGDPGDEYLLRRLPIHRFGAELFTSVEVDVWLAPQEEPVTYNTGHWRELKSKCRIVERFNDPWLASRQAQIFEGRILDRNGVIRLCALQPNACQFANLILECLSYGTPSREAADSLRQSAWLPLKEGGSCEMKQVIWIAGLELEINQVLRVLPAELGLVTRSKLAVDWDTNWAAGGWRTVSNVSNPLIPCNARLVEALRPAISSCPETHLGIGIDDPITIRRWAVAVRGNERSFSPAASFVCRLVEEDPRLEAGWLWDLCRLLFCPWNSSESARFDDALDALQVRHEELALEERQYVEEVFYSYLSAAKDAGRWSSAYRSDPDFLLLNARGEWTKISRLTTQLPGISSSAVLHPVAAKVLGLDGTVEPVEVATPGTTSVIGQDSDLMTILRNYAEELGERLNRRHWGLFLALLGDNVRDLAPEFLESVGVDSIRVDLVGERQTELATEPRIRLVMARYRCEVVPPGNRILSALSGAAFEASMEDRPFSLLVPVPGNGGRNLHFRPVDEGTCKRIEFSLVAPKALAGLSPAELRQCLINTINLHQEEVLGVSAARRAAVGSVFDTVQQLDNLYLSTAQQELLGSARLHLIQMGFAAEPASAVSEALDELEEADRLRAQAREERAYDFGNARESERAAATKENQGIERLRNAIVSDRGIQTRISQAIARRIEQEQYQLDSIPFELFQNADDAYLDFGVHSETPPMFVVDFREGGAFFGHLGRPINQASTADEAVRKRQRRDLVKMLILHGSEKTNDTGLAHTGKFGLGFKSVFLICHKPEILSADLAFEILGGFYPRRLSIDRSSYLREWLSTHLPTPSKGTVIHLQTHREVSHFVTRFRNLAPFLPVFAKAIRDVRILGTEPHRWHPEPIHSGDGWSAVRGSIRLAGSSHEILVVTNQKISWLFGAEAHRLLQLPNLPCLWITAPTMESEDLGFALNAPFDPDPGRTRLTSSATGRQHNTALFKEAAGVLESFIRRQLADESSRREFAESCWRLFGRPALYPEASDGRNALLKCLWEERQGYRAVLDSENFLPNGLQGGLFRLTRLPAVRFTLAGFLDAKPGRSFLEALLEWDEWKHAALQMRIQPGELLSAAVASALKSKGVFSSELSELTTVGILTRLLGTEQRLEPGVAAMLGAFFTEQQLFNPSEEQDRYNWPDVEKNILLDWLRKLQFLNQKGDWKSARGLLTCEGGPVEKVRAAFAPDIRRLHADYEANLGAIRLFQLCRGEMELGACELLAWLEEVADTPEGERTNASLGFLSSDDLLLSKVTSRLSSRARTFFLSCNVFSKRPLADQNRIRNAFQAGVLFGAQEEGRLFTFSDSTLGDDPQEPATDITVVKILEAWDPSEALDLFTLSGPLQGLILPDSNDDEALREALRSENVPRHRECWFRLLCLGCTLSLPLGRHGLQAVEGLWEEELGPDFWAALTPQNGEGVSSSGFNARLDRIFHEKIHTLFRDQNATGEYADFWRLVFYDFRKMHYFVFENHLPETILELASMDGADGDALVNFLRNGRIPAHLAGGATRFRGVLGQSAKTPLLFLLRELRRLKVLDRNEFNPACMYMNAPARRVARRLSWIDEGDAAGGDFANIVAISERVYKRLEEELPELTAYFDLPLQLYARKEFS